MGTAPYTRKRDLEALKEPTPSEHRLLVTTEVKYHLLILEEWLTRKAQLKNVMNKARRAFWTCKGISGKTWDLNLHHGDHMCADLWLQGLVAKDQTQCQQEGTQYITDIISMCGHNMGDEDNPYSCSGGPPET